jgi:nickel-dependent lactate racemase
VIAVGAHAQLSQEEVRRKVGVRIAETYAVRSHDINGPLADSGQRVGNLPLLLDGRFLQADRRLTVGSVIPNPYAGFSGGGKMVLPGLAGVDVLVWLHRLAQMGGSSGPGVPGNRIRMEIDRVTSALPLHGSVLCLVDSGRQVREIFCGPPVPTHRHAAAVAASRYRTPLSGIYDVFICNAYPKDAEFIQSATGYTPVRTGGQRHLAEGGTVVLLSAAYRGIGEHALFGSGGPLHRSRNTPHPELGGADVAVFTTGVSASEVAVTHWPGYPVYSRWEDVVSHLLARFGSHARVGIFPAAALQLGPGS